MRVIGSGLVMSCLYREKNSENCSRQDELIRDNVLKPPPDN